MTVNVKKTSTGTPSITMSELLSWENTLFSVSSKKIFLAVYIDETDYTGFPNGK